MVSDGDGLVTSVLLPLPLREVWPWFREPDLIRRWHGWEYDGLADEIQEIYVDGARVGEDHRSISFGTHLFSFCEVEGSTRLDVRRAPLEDDTELAPYVDDIDEGWTSFVQQLRFVLERHPEDPRRTHYLTGTPNDPTISPIQWLGLGQAGLQEVGASYGASVGPGDALTGRLWFTAEHQVGLTVDDWGDGLLVVSDGRYGGPPYTQGSATLTTYGLGDDEHRDRADRWRTWWGHHYHQDS